MKFAQPDLANALDTLPRIPSWVTSARAETLEDVTFLSGAALATLHFVVGYDDVPRALLCDRLSLTASEACMRLLGRPERAGDLRDEVHLLRPGDQPGPAGAIYQQWQRASARPISVKALQRALPSVTAEQIAMWLDTGSGGPVMRAGTILETVLSAHPRQEVTALILADAVLAQSLGWTHVLPLLAVGLKSRDLRKQGRDLQLACHNALVSSIGATLPLAADLTRRAAHLRAVIPKLRAKGAGDAVALFLSKDALSASVALADLMSDRAARRLCDRLVDLGVVRELTGRDTFRLYGV
ncbi:MULTISPECIES: DUF1403 family protein [unclassified Sulfitobacter]|uniref:DUF1403 family protein n=1 Tax=unclassified Sulfitobacter TaxID=196795 RepID=UPI0004E3B2A8|nr:MULTISPECIES: DUF1403 family protein [unclassified Sulfitobacter]PTA97673.1 DUF1403 domain-containing protein [Sulfitobacter sp. CB-A]ULO22134.1 DUF1403 family protein [Sulfitobacter sp. CB2047]